MKISTETDIVVIFCTLEKQGTVLISMKRTDTIKSVIDHDIPRKARDCSHIHVTH